MATLTPVRGPRALIGRRKERFELDRLLDGVRAGQSHVLVVRGEAGTGKTALLEYLAGQASDFRIARAVGVQSELELPFAGLHQLLAPMLNRLDSLDDLPSPQKDALQTALGMTPGRPPDRFLIGLAVLSLLGNVGEEQPLLCLVDDQQWLDRESAQVFGFVGRRLEAEGVGLVVAAREEADDLAGVPRLVVEGLAEDDAAALVDSIVAAPLDAQVRDQIVSETRGFPLAIIELLHELTPAELAGGYGLPTGTNSHPSVEETYRRWIEALPLDSQRFVRLAAADPIGDPALVWRAAEHLGIPATAANTAAEAGLVEIGARVLFRHPSLRSVAYRSASVQERHDIHRALAEVSDPETEPDRRAWHRAQASTGPDEQIATELQRAADGAQARGGLAAAAAFLERATELTLDQNQLARRALSAAQAKYHARDLHAALRLLATAERAPANDVQRASLRSLRGQIALSSGHSGDAPPLLLEAATLLAPLDVEFTRDAFLDAISASMFVGRLPSPVGLKEIAAAATAAPAARPPARPQDLLLDGLAALFTLGCARGAPLVERALTGFRNDGMTVEEELRWLALACRCVHYVWDDEAWEALSARQLELARSAGALNALPLALAQRVGIHIHAGRFDEAASLVAEERAIAEAFDYGLPAYGGIALAAWQGREAEATQVLEDTKPRVSVRGEGLPLGIAHFNGAVLNNGLGRYADALAAAELATANAEDEVFTNWGLVELVEAGVRSGHTACAIAAVERIAASVRATGTAWGLGMEARSRALVSEGPAAEELYQEAIDQLSRSLGVMVLARARLVYGEWLRRERRRIDAREQLRSAHELFASVGAEAFADRAARELLATGETVRKRQFETRDELTAQEVQIARLARDGLTNPEIGTRLFISPRTVQYHLHKVFSKLEISSREQLGRVLPAEPPR